MTTPTKSHEHLSSNRVVHQLLVRLVLVCLLRLVVVPRGSHGASDCVLAVYVGGVGSDWGIYRG
jgi:hypothetical protein